MLPRFTFTDRAAPFLEIGVGDTRVETGTARWGSARWDDEAATWSGVEPSWLDVSCFTFAARCEYGRRRSNDRFVAGLATITADNASGWADPYGTGDIAALTMRGGRAIRFGIDHVTLGRVVLWRGFIDEIVPTYERDLQYVTFQCIDALGEVNRAKLAGNAASGAGEFASDRVVRLLNAAEWPSEKREIHADGTRLIEAALNGQVADMLGRCADSAGGAVFGDRNGNVVFRQRDWQTFMPDTPVAATIGNVGEDDVCPVSWTRPFARADIATVAIMGRDAETAQVAVDTTGKILYGYEPFERVDLWTQDDDRLADLANRALEVRSYATAPVIRSVNLDAYDAHDDPRALDLMAIADPYAPTLIRCRHQVGAREVFDDDCLVTGIVHELSADSWTASINLDLAAPYAAAGGRWDRGHWGRSTWAA